MNYEQFINKFLESEKKLDLKGASGVVYLQTRFSLFRRIQSTLMDFTSVNAVTINFSGLFIFFEFLSFLIILIKFPFFLFRGCYLFCENFRPIIIKDIYVDPCTFLSQKTILRNKKLVCRIGVIKNGIKDIKPFNFKYLFISKFQIYALSIILNIILFPIFMLYFFQFFINLRRNQFFSKYIDTSFKLKFFLRASENIATFFILVLLRPKKVSVVDGYNTNSSFIVLANILGVDSYEYQHGMISAQHIGYVINIKNKNLLHYYSPKNMYLWSMKWKDIVPTIKEKYTVGIDWTYEYLYFYKEIEFDIKVKEKKKSIDILLIGQPTIQKELVELANFLSNNLQKASIVYKKHPKESIPLDLCSTVEVKEDNLYSLLAITSVCIGGFSTVLLESRSMGIKTCSLSKIVPLDYLQVLDHFNITILENHHDILNFIYKDDKFIEFSENPINLSHRLDLDYE
jgi:hypothetical protein